MPEPIQADAEPSPADIDGHSVRDLIGQLVADTKSYARAEMEFVRAEVGDRTSHFGPAAGLLTGAAILLLAALVAVMVGLMFWIGLATGLGWAILIVASASGLLATILIRLGLRHLGQITRPWEKP